MSKVGELGRSSGKNSQQDPLSRVFFMWLSTSVLVCSQPLNRAFIQSNTCGRPLIVYQLFKVFGAKLQASTSTQS